MSLNNPGSTLTFIEAVGALHTPGATGSWIALDLSGDVPTGTKYAVCWLYAGSAVYHGVRKTGSALSRQLTTTGSMVTVELDGSRACEVYYNVASALIVQGYWV
jgi:hypothetical protein